MTPAASSEPRPSSLVPAEPRAIYYLHPLQAGPIDCWASHFERCCRMGFDHVLIAPPFLPGRGGDLFLTVDHARLHPILGAIDALTALSRLASEAAGFGLGLMLDLVIDRVAEEARLLREHPEFAARRNTALPDPRRPPPAAGAAVLDFATQSDALLHWWGARIAEWRNAGIKGFRADAPQRQPAGWRDLIAAARRDPSPCSFLAGITGVAAEDMQALVPVGFDLACSSSWAWNFRDDWLDADTRRVRDVGRVLAMPELPFGPRLAQAGEGFGPRARRAALFAAGFGEAWMMPMGFEFAAHRPLDAKRDGPEDFAMLAARGSDAAEAFLAEANNLHRDCRGLPPGATISAPGSSIAAVLRRADRARGAALLVNADLDCAASLPAARLLSRGGGGAWSWPDGTGQTLSQDIAMEPGGVRLLTVGTTSPILHSETSTPATATRAPRIAIEAIAPTVDAGRFAAKRPVGSLVEVSADIIVDGHPLLAAVLLWRPSDTAGWQEAPMTLLVNDRWQGQFPIAREGRHVFTIEAWLDEFASFRDELRKKHAAGVTLVNEIKEGRALVATAAKHNPALASIVTRLDASGGDSVGLLLAPETAALMRDADRRPFRTRHEPPLPVDAERRGAGFASWYELFPRSQSNDPARHGTFSDVIARLPAVRDMGFDVLYMPPIHPIGATNRKGRNNALKAGPSDPGSPYAIGGAAGGHDAIHPELGTLDDFRALIAAARAMDMEIAIDFAIQCSPDHPWLRDHPDWFEWRPDGSIRYAENPPKRYEDIVNVAFYAEGARPALWLALRDVVLFWAREGVRCFRVDNPHTKPLPFWEWMIAEVRREFPDALFLAEAFTRPKMMYRLAKIGFAQSYTYFTWRDTAHEMREYLTELTTTAPKDFFRPHFFVNTPDINPLFLQSAGRPGFLIRAALAATLSGLWGIYSGFELCESDALPGREEYRDSEKYEIRARDWLLPGNIVAEIRTLNRIRRNNPALHSHLGIRFLPCSNDMILCFAKVTGEGDNIVIAAISFDPGAAQSAEIVITPATIGLAADAAIQLEDLLHGGSTAGHTGPRQITLNPYDLPYALWRVSPPTRG